MVGGCPAFSHAHALPGWEGQGLEASGHASSPLAGEALRLAQPAGHGLGSGVMSPWLPGGSEVEVTLYSSLWEGNRILPQQQVLQRFQRLVSKKHFFLEAVSAMVLLPAFPTSPF